MVIVAFAQNSIYLAMSGLAWGSGRRDMDNRCRASAVLISIILAVFLNLPVKVDQKHAIQL